MSKFIICLFTTAGMLMQVHGQTDFVKDPNNPVFPRGANGRWDDQLVTNPYVLFDGNLYHLWHAGYDGSSGTNIGYAYSSDGISNWTRHPNAVLTTGPSGSWDDITVYQPCVLFDGTTYHMWFGGHDGTTRQIGYATSISADSSWNKDTQHNPVLTPGDPGDWDDVWVDSPEVLFINGVYHMWYSGNDGSITQIGHATSSDKITWEKDSLNPVLKVAPGEWDDVMCYQPSVLFDGTDYRMWYSGGPVFQWSIGYAHSSDGSNWDKDTLNPVLEPEAGTWDHTYVGLCGVLFDANSSIFKMWYGGGTGIAVGDIGYATAPYISSSIRILDGNVPNAYVLHQNYPNPFNPTTNIKFSIPQSGFVTLKVYNVLGKEMATLVSERLAAGNYNYDWDGSGLASGVYLYRIQTGDYVEAKKMVLLR